LIDQELPDLVFCYRRIGSRAGSRDYPQFSSKIQRPNWIASSIVLRSDCSLGLRASKGLTFFDPKFLMNLFA